MTNDASQLMAEALRVAKLDGSFSPAELGAKIGLRPAQAEAAARELSNAGVLVLGFDFDASFSPDFRRVQARAQHAPAAAKAKAVASADRKSDRINPDPPAAGRAKAGLKRRH